MFLLDTNVLSVMMSPAPAAEVVTWLLSQPSEKLFTAAVCQAEILAGIAILPKGRRRSDLETAAQAMFADDFQGRVLPFDTDAATAYGEIFAGRRKTGRPIATLDVMIAAIARTQGASIVTCNVVDFEGGGPTIINPWTS